MVNNKSSHKPVVLASITTTVLMLIFGLTYRILEARLLTPLSNIPINSTALDEFPLQIHDWTGQDCPINEAEIIMDKICAEACINRLYLCNDKRSVLLFIAASGVTEGTMVGHAPEICNVVNGYQLVNQSYMDLTIDNVSNLSCKILRFERDRSFGSEKKVVLYYYMADGQFCGTRSQLRRQVRLGSKMINCIGQVQIAASTKETVGIDSTIKIVSDFAVESAPMIAELFKSIQKNQVAESVVALKNGEVHQ